MGFQGVVLEACGDKDDAVACVGQSCRGVGWHVVGSTGFEMGGWLSGWRWCRFLLLCEAKKIMGLDELL